MTRSGESTICWHPDGGSAKRVHVAAIGDRGRTLCGLRVDRYACE
jgi:hypothetical protein